MRVRTASTTPFGEVRTRARRRQSRPGSDDSGYACGFGGSTERKVARRGVGGGAGRLCCWVIWNRNESEIEDDPQLQA